MMLVMTLGVRLRVPVLLLALLLPLGLVAGCGGDDRPEPASGPGLPSQAELKSYFEAIVSADPDELAKVQSDVTEDGSLAQVYAAYDAEFALAAAAVGQTGEPPEVEEVDGGFKACVGDSPGQCATWTDLEGKDGRLTDFDINDIELSDLLVDLTAQSPIRSAGLYRVQPDYAYRQPNSGKLFVLCTVTASDVPLSPEPGIYIEEDKTFKGIEAPSPETIEAGTSSPIVLAFADAKDTKLDGQVTFDLKLGDKQTESIGFGLADPAAS
jgi:hypothetical protein